MNRANLDGQRVTRVGAGLVAALASLAVVACAGPSASENFFALNDGAVVVSATTSTPRAGQPTIAQKSSLPGIVISAVTIPELIDRPQIVTRDSTNRVIVSEQNLWAESVKSGVGRTLATRLARAMSDAGQPVQVAAHPQTAITDPVLRITIDVVRFDAEPNGEAVVDALWSIRRMSDGMVRTGHTVASSPISGTSYQAIVGGWNEAVAVVDRDIAAMVLTIGTGPATSSR
jgi:uncharacterized lipoprotein YmbA